MRQMILVLMSGCLLPEAKRSPQSVEGDWTSSSTQLQLDPVCSDLTPSEKLHIVTWNIQWFPKNGRITVDYVSDIINQLDIDVLAVQELDDRRVFDQLLSSLPGYEGYYESAWFAGLAYIYKSDVIEINDIYEIYSTSPYWLAFPRSPMVMDMNAYGERYVIVNNHLKCCGNGYLDVNDEQDEETRRYQAANYLKQYIDTNWPDSKVMVLGDLNDNIAEDPSNNVFQGFLDFPERYRFVDMDIATGSHLDWSFPSWPSHLDHILVTDELFLQVQNSEVYTIKIDSQMGGGFFQYEQDISDHRPVGICLSL